MTRSLRYQSHDDDMRIGVRQQQPRLSAWRAVDLGLAVLVLTIALWQLLPGVTTTPFHRDEARWIYRVQLIKDWRHPLSEQWQDDGYPIGTGSLDERTRMSGQPPFASYLLGIGMLLQGRDLTTNDFWVMDQDDAWNNAHGNMPSAADLRAARRTNVVLAALAVVAVYFIGKRLTNRVGGFIGAASLAVHPLLFDVATRAWADTTLIFLLAFAAIAAYRLADHPTWERAVLLGALIGFAGATKLSPLLLSAPLAAFGVVPILYRRFIWTEPTLDPPTNRVEWKLVAQPLIALAFFVLSYPYLWPHPIDNTYKLFKFRADSFSIQAAAFPQAKVLGVTDAFRRVGDELGHRFSSARHLVTALSDAMGFTVPPGWHIEYIDLALAVIGLELLIALVVLRGFRMAPILAATIFGGEAAIVVLTMGVEYARYLVPVLLAVVIGIGVTGGLAWSGLRVLYINWATRTRPATAPSTMEPTSDPASF
ncbi:MAG TPA: glycosyltransferase family 39 protein [Thermomicrobiales bacterium]|nr:glycosyltransferase family 39 protein [Thermomicrobiales bacterium]